MFLYLLRSLWPQYGYKAIRYQFMRLLNSKFDPKKSSIIFKNLYGPYTIPFTSPVKEVEIYWETDTHVKN